MEIWRIGMVFYKVGSMGDEVKRIQERLGSLGFYKGLIDGDFGGGTEAAVKALQKTKGLTVDGIVGQITWNALFEEEIPKPVIFSKPLDYKCLALTGSFETGRGVPECFAGLSGHSKQQNTEQSERVLPCG